MTWDPGSSFEAPGELLPDMRLMVSLPDKARAFLYDIARSLNMPRGALWYAQDRGTPICEFIADVVDPRVAASQINAECKKDSRCARATTDIVVAAGGAAWSISINVYAKDGTVYELVFLASAEKATLLLAGPKS